jgi:gamma-aminobutyric acid type B receptor
MSSAIIPMSIDDGVASVHGCNIACMSAPWIFSIGFAITFSALFAKIWRIHTVMSSAVRFTRVVVRERDAMKWIILVFTLNVILLICWTLIDPLQWKRQYINGGVTNSYGSCRADGNASNAFAGLLILVDGAALLAALILAFKARNLEDEFTESKWIGVACASWIQVILIGVPIVLLTRTQPVAQVLTFIWLYIYSSSHFHHSSTCRLF